MKRHMNVWEQLWEQLRESTEGPTVTLQVPRDVADQLLSMLATSLEVGDGEGGMEPDADDFGGPPDGDADDMGMPPMDDGGDEDMFDLGDDTDDDSDDDDSDDGDDDDDDDDDEKDEAADYAHSGGNPSGLRPQTAFGESLRRQAARGSRAPSSVLSGRGPSRRRR